MLLSFIPIQPFSSYFASRAFLASFWGLSCLSLRLRDRQKKAYAMADSKSSSDLNLRCHHCAGPLSKEMETSGWTLSPVIRDSFSMIGSAVGGTASAFYGFNHVMPVVQKWVKGPMWLHFLIGAPPVMIFSSACAGLTGGAVPALAQLASSSYHATLSSPSQDEKKMYKSRNSSTL